MKLNRNIVNFIRNILENWVPPVLRDSVLFYYLLKLVFKNRAAYYAAFRPNLIHLNAADYKNYYQNFPNIMGQTDLNDACIKNIIKNIAGENILDAGCGRGFLLESIKKSGNYNLTGVDIHVDESMAKRLNTVRFVSSFIDALPFKDKEFDTVVCTHTLEHVINLSNALNELRRVAKNRLIIVVPKEREYKYSFNLHVHFFPYLYSFLNQVNPKKPFTCIELQGDIYYQEDMSN